MKPNAQVVSLQQKFWRCFNTDNGNFQILTEKL